MGFTNPYPASRLTVDSTNSLVTGMQAWFPLTEGTGTSAQCILHPSHTGTLNGGVSWENGERGVVASFDGADDFIETNSNSTVTSFPITVSAWVKSSGSSRDVIFGSYNAVGTDRSLQCEIDAAGKMYMLCSSTGSYQSTNRVTGTTTLSTTEYSHVVFVFEASGGTLYLNGEVESSSGSLFSTLNTPVVNFLIGAQGTSSSNQLHFDGNISNVQVWDRAITATEVTTLYHRPWEGSNYGDIWPYSPPAAGSMTLSSDASATSLMTNCIGWWPLTNGGSSTSAKDIVGTNDGTLNGGAGWSNTSIGNAFQGDGVDGTNITASVSATSQPVTISCWWRSDAALAYAFDGPNSSNRLAVFQYNNNLSFWGGSTQINMGTGFNDGEWHHIAVVFNGSSSAGYVDGVLKASGTVGSVQFTGLTIGSRFNGVGSNPDNIQNLRVWDRVLSADEVLLLYERPWEGEASYGDVFHHDPPAPASMLPLDNASGINTGLAAWYPLTETDDYASSVTDISGGAYHGSAHNGASSKSSLVGGVADFDGSNDYMNLGTSFWNDNIASGDDFCVNFWFNVDDISSDGAILGCWSTEQNFFIWVDVGGANVSLTSIGSGVGYGYTSVDLPVVEADRWYMGTLVADGTAGTVSVYLDGVFEVSASYSASLSTNTEPMGLASERGSSNQRQMDGRIGNVRFWSRVLTADEVWSIYANPWLGSNYKLASGSTPLYNYIFRTERFRRLG